MTVRGSMSDEALKLMEQAMRLDPHHPDWFKWNLAWIQWAKGDCDSALTAIRSMAKLPNRARRMLAVIQICLGQQSEAEATIAEFLENDPGYTIAKLDAESGKRYKDRTLHDRLADALRQAGLPDE